jgi:hypothetical protein
MVLLSSVAFCVAALGLCLYSLIRRVVEWQRLRHIPGPFLAGWTDLWLLRHVVPGTLCTKLYGVCQEYGK